MSNPEQKVRHAAARMMLLLLTWAVVPGVGAQATSAAQATADDADGDGNPVPVVSASAEPALLKVANRPIVTLRAGVYGAPAAERARLIQEGIMTAVERGGPLRVTTRAVADGTGIFIDDVLAFRVLELDVNPDAGEVPAKTAARAAANLRIALAELREARDTRAVFTAIGYSLLATVLFLAALWLVFRAHRRVIRAVDSRVKAQAARLGLDGHVAGHSSIGELVAVTLKLLAWILALLLAFQWTGFVLEQFPYTRPWGEALMRNLLHALAGFGTSILTAIPGLMFVALIFFVARFVVRAVRGFFDAIREGRVQTNVFDATTAPPTGRLLGAVIWLFALVAAYPYLPGSGSEAFKGIGVFVGLMLSIGASGIVNQAVSGFMLMYTRALRPGEYVQIGEIEGTVKSVGYLTTRLETLRREEINMPNALVASNVTRNYSRLAADGGLGVATKITIGYDVPWRQVHAMLLMAAARVPDVVAEPPPRVLQTALNDFYVEYTMIVMITEPSRRIAILSDVHAHIQDVFNEFGVQIMSPNYEADPAQPKVVPRDEWFKAPATAAATTP